MVRRKIFYGRRIRIKGETILASLQKAGWTDDMLKEATKIDDTGKLVNAVIEPKIPATKKLVDVKFTVQGKEYWIEHSTFKDPKTGELLKLTDKKQILNKLGQEAKHFSAATSSDNIVVIELNKGTSLSKAEIEEEVLAIYNTPDTFLKDIQKIIFYNVEKVEVIPIPKP